MRLIDTGIRDLIVIEPDVFGDARGYFTETWNQVKYAELGIITPFVQDNESMSCYGVIRGLHYQIDPYAQHKLVRVISGAVLDVAVDIRRGSPTFGKHYAIELNSDNKLQMLIPAGFAHGFSVLSECAVFSYKCSTLYRKEWERGINIFDTRLGIDWKIPSDQAVISEKDLQQPMFEDSDFNFTYK
jgi:dTDP-4-dehydrorhamnose 3,5-epimerase